MTKENIQSYLQTRNIAGGASLYQKKQQQSHGHADSQNRRHKWRGWGSQRTFLYLIQNTNSSWNHIKRLPTEVHLKKGWRTLIAARTQKGLVKIRGEPIHPNRKSYDVRIATQNKSQLTRDALSEPFIVTENLRANRAESEQEMAKIALLAMALPHLK